MMTIKDIGEMLQLLEANYGSAFWKDTNRDNVVKLWSVMFADDDPSEVGIAVKDCIATLQFPPKIADIKSRIANNRMAGQMTEMEAWSVIRDAVERATSRQEAEKIFSQMPKILQRTVGSASQLRGWRVVDDANFETVVASNCQRTYRMLAQREAGYHALPTDIQQAEAWRIEKPTQAELPAPEAPKKLAYEKPEWMIRREQMGENKPQTDRKKDGPDELDLILMGA